MFRLRVIKTLIALLSLCAGATIAADVSFYGRFYGAAAYDFADGSLAPDTPGLAPEEGGAAEPVLGDGDPRYNFRYHADIGVVAAFNDRVTGTCEFTFDDRKKPTLYRYALVRDALGDVYLEETAHDASVYASLEQVNARVADVIWDTDLTVGGYDVRYGHGGYFNDLFNRFEPASFVAYLDPFGARLARRFGPLAATLDVGAGLNHQPVVATSQNVGTFTFFAAAEGQKYDLLTLWQSHYIAALPKYRRYFEVRAGDLAPAPLAADGGLGDTIHVGAENTWRYGAFSVYGLAAFHRFADAPEIWAEPSGGFLIQVYPEVAVEVLPERAVVQAGALYEYWFANAEATFGGASQWNNDFIIFGEPAYYLVPELMLGVVGRYWEPNGHAPDNDQTSIDETKSFSLTAGPHVRYTPVAGVTVDLTYTYTRWDYMFNPMEPDTFETDRELKLELEAVF